MTATSKPTPHIMARKASNAKEAENTQEQRLSIEDKEPEIVETSGIINLGGNDEQEDQQVGEQNGEQNGMNGSDHLEAPYSPLFMPEEAPPAITSIRNGATKRESVGKAVVTIVVPPVERRWEYQTYSEAPVDRVMQEYDDGVELKYLIRLRDGSKQKVSQICLHHWSRVFIQVTT